MVQLRTSDRIVAIIGLPATGKTTLANQLLLEYPDYKYFEADEFIGQEEYLLTLLLMHPGKILLCGTGALGIIFIGLTRGFFPDLIIMCSATSADRERRYSFRGKNFQRGRIFDDAWMRKYWKYRNARNPKPPRDIIDYET